jgi:hypothetical protein
MTLGITTQGITTFGITTQGIMTLDITTLSIQILSIKDFFLTLSITTLCHYAEGCILFIVILNVIKLFVIMLSAVAPIVEPI